MTWHDQILWYYCFFANLENTLRNPIIVSLRHSNLERFGNWGSLFCVKSLPWSGCDLYCPWQRLCTNSGAIWASGSMGAQILSWLPKFTIQNKEAQIDINLLIKRFGAQKQSLFVNWCMLKLHQKVYLLLKFYKKSQAERSSLSVFKDENISWSCQ